MIKESIKFVFPKEFKILVKGRAPTQPMAHPKAKVAKSPKFIAEVTPPIIKLVVP